MDPLRLKFFKKLTCSPCSTPTYSKGYAYPELRTPAVNSKLITQLLHAFSRSVCTVAADMEGCWSPICDQSSCFMFSCVAAASADRLPCCTAECLGAAGRERRVCQVSGGCTGLLHPVWKIQNIQRAAKSQRAARLLHLPAASGNPR